jgi:DNA-binding transcriptional MerR regulator
MGLLKPVENPKGRGKTRRYSKMNLYQLLIIKELAQNGYDLTTIKQTVKTPFTYWKTIRNKPKR